MRWNFLQHTCPKLYPGILTKQFITFTHTIHVPILIYTVYYKHVPMFSSHTLEINTVYLWNGYLIKVCCYCTGHIYYFEIMQVNKLGNLSRLLTSIYLITQNRVAYTVVIFIHVYSLLLGGMRHLAIDKI